MKNIDKLFGLFIFEYMEFITFSSFYGGVYT